MIKLDLPIFELMRRGAFACKSEAADAELAALADAAGIAAERAGRAIDDALDFVRASNARLAALEDRARKPGARQKGIYTRAAAKITQRR